MALPTISSDSPSLYMSAVSMRLIPASRAASTMAVASSWVVRPIAPKFIAPSASVLTCTPVRPKVRYCMSRVLHWHDGSNGTCSAIRYGTVFRLPTR